ncbi:MAG: hypothetical protein ISS15_01660 [Alphaproteobacteria bacterium]|nr:hypothetical protein [Alphaproteobacteria bacterium]MBL6937100.1 hypothetical protein [Alphaproteobacteria bacterium]MBL7096338.1 hypothetical protein [Alphaproteobacteria bacterium]
MTEKLVLWKWDAWRRADGWLLLAVPPGVVFGARLIEHGPSLLGAMFAFLTPLILPGLSNALAANLNAGEWVSPDEHRRRALEKLLEGSQPRLLAWLALAAFAWLGSAMAAFVDLSRRERLLSLLGYAIVASLLVAAFRYFSARRHLMLLTDAMRENWPEMPVWWWLPGALVLRYATTGVSTVVGFVLGRHFASPYSLFVLAFAIWLGFGAETVIRNSLGGKARPVLWTQVGFGGALVLSFLLLGLPFAPWGAVMPLLVGDPTPLVSAVAFGIGMGLFGTVIGMLSWVQAKLNNTGPRNQAG